jgi:hypothetical protein
VTAGGKNHKKLPESLLAAPRGDRYRVPDA